MEYSIVKLKAILKVLLAGLEIENKGKGAV